MDATLVQIDGYEVERRLLDQRGGPFPLKWAGRPVPRPSSGPYPESSGPFPRLGWRWVAGSRTRSGDVADLPVFAAPATQPGRWWTVLLFHAGNSWRPVVAPPEPERPGRRQRPASSVGALDLTDSADGVSASARRR